MKNPKIALGALALMAGITAFSIFKYAASLKENFALTSDVEKLSIEVQSLEEERKTLTADLEQERRLQQALSAENTATKDALQDFKQQFGRLETELQLSQITVDELGQQLSAIKAENLALRDQVQVLQLDVSQARQDNAAMKEQLGSVKELKKAIKALRVKMRSEKHKVALRVASEELIVGNAGYLIKDGRTTYPSRVKIDVSPASGSGTP